MLLQAEDEERGGVCENIYHTLRVQWSLISVWYARNNTILRSTQGPQTAVWARLYQWSVMDFALCDLIQTRMSSRGKRSQIQKCLQIELRCANFPRISRLLSGCRLDWDGTARLGTAYPELSACFEFLMTLCS